MAPTKLTGKHAQIAAFIDKFDVFLFDCDGVLWHGNTLLHKIVDTLDMLRSKGEWRLFCVNCSSWQPPQTAIDIISGKQIVFVTNNSTKSRRAYKKKLDSLGIPAKVDEIFGSAYSSAVYIKRVVKLPADKKVYVIGESGIEEELESEGVRYFGGTDPEERTVMQEEDYTNFVPDPEVGVVLCGLDNHINYRKYAKAFQYLQDPNTLFLATNVDSTFPNKGKLFPGAGSISAPLSYMTKRVPISLGKPSQAMMDSVEGKFQFDRKRTCMVGDRIDTDIKFGIAGGLGGTLAVLTGVATEEDILNAGPEGAPDAYLDKLSDLLG